MSNFTSKDIPDLDGQIIIVTGGNAGLGLEAIRQLGAHNPARIYLAARSKQKAEAAIEELDANNPRICPIAYLELDLASFASVKAAAVEFLSKETRLDILINNAGIMMTPEGLTQDGYEIQFGTNVMGHALFTNLLLPVLRRTGELNPQTRVVQLSSASHAMAPKDVYSFDELRTTAPQRHTTTRYITSKLANIHMAKALAEREEGIKVIPVHPGMVATNLHHGSTGWFLRPFLFVAGSLFATPLEKGALSQIWAAVSPDAKSGKYYGPIGKAEAGSNLSRDHKLQEELYEWVESELREHIGSAERRG